MKRFTSIQLGGGTLRYASYLILSLFLVPNYSFSQCNIACNDRVQISIEADCTAGVTPDALLEGALPTGSYTITFDNGQVGTAADGTSVFAGIDWSTLIGETGYTIKADDCNNSCWGNARVEQNVFPGFNGEIKCEYIPGFEGTKEVELNAGNIVSGTTVEITLPRCDNSQPRFSISGEINFPCASAASGWCTIKCNPTNIVSGVDVSGNNLIWEISVTVSDVALATEYLNTISSTIICELDYIQDPCIPVDCETWCGGNPPDFVTIDELRLNLRSLTGDCVNNITNLREVIKTSGDVCDGIITVVETYGDFTQHGVTESRLLLSQAYKQLPIPLFDPMLGGALNPNIIFPGKKVVDCGEATDPESLESVPLFHNLWKEVITYPDTCKLVHYQVAVDTVREPIEIVPGVWSVQDVVKKELRDSMRCAPDSSEIAAIMTNPFETLYPSKFCNLLSSFSDFETPLCGNGKKIIRDWTIIDWCLGKLEIQSQVIEERDTTPPVGPTESVTHTIGTEPWTCNAIFDFDMPVFTDNCDDDLEITFDIINSGGVWVPVEALTPGTYTIEFRAIDDCNNASNPHTDILIVVDDVPPVAVCKDKLIVSITPDVGGGVAKILAEDFDRGSHDGGCGSISKIQVIRHEDFDTNIDHAFGGMSFAGLPVSCDPLTGEISIVDKDKFGDDLPEVTGVLAKWHESVKFCCEDIGPDNMVLLRVWDDANNYNDCMVNVEVQDKTLFSCPDNITIMCTEYAPDVVFGMAETNLVCSNGNATFEDEADLDGCGAGRVLRIWTSTNGSGVESSCPQIITVEGENVFDPASIRWPIHYKGGEPGSGIRLEPKDDECVELPAVIEFEPVLDCMDAAPDCGPEYDESAACGLVGVSMKSDTVYVDNNTCLKVIRRWTVIDWCTWAPNGDTNAVVGDDDNDTDADQFQLVEDWCLDSGCIKEQEGSKYYRYTPKEEGGYYDEDGYYTYDQILLYHDDTQPEFLSMEVDTTQPGTENSCFGNIALVNSAMDQGFCGADFLQWYVTLLDSTGTQYGSIQTGTGNAFGFTVSDIPLGDYTIVWNVKDGCGNAATQETSVTLEDTSKPTPICIQNISTAVMNTNGEVEIWAADFDPDGKSSDPCDDEVVYSFAENEYVPNLTITCADLIGQSEEMFVYVQDLTGNASACRVNLRVDHNGICDDYVCEAEGGELLIDVTDLTEITVCTRGDNTGFSTKVWENIGESSFLVTDEDGNILATPVGPDFDFGGIGPGVCYLWHVSSEGTLRGVEVGKNAADIVGCYSLSNPIIVTRVSGGIECDGACDVEGGRFVTDVTDLDAVSVCVSGDNTGFSAKVWENLGDPSQLITDADGNILSIPVGPDFDFAGQAPGVCYLWHVSSDGILTGIEVGNNVSDIVGCYVLSNPIIVTKVDSGEACESLGDGSALIAGNVSTAFGESIGEARVMLNNSFIAEYPVSQMTSGLTGNYAFATNPMYSDYSVSVEKNDDHMNGVSTLDLVYMQHHILGLKPLDSAYKVIAADINDDQRITASDLVVLRKLILGIIGELPANSSWRFIDKNQVLNNINQPWPFVEELAIEDLSSDMSGQDFVGVKIGDVNGSASPNSLVSTEVRTNNTTELTIDNQSYDVGDIVEVNVSSEALTELAGFQMTVSHEGLEFIGVKSNTLDLTEDNTAKHGAVTAISWHAEQLMNVDGHFMTLVFLATENAELSDAIQATDRIIASEVYLGAGFEINSVDLTFNEGELEGPSFELLQNKPNPFSDVTEIGFKLAKSDLVTLKLYDVAGRLIHKQSGQYNTGLNTITISSEIIESGGLIYYSLESGDYSATRKMILLK